MSEELEVRVESDYNLDPHGPSLVIAMDWLRLPDSKRELLYCALNMAYKEGVNKAAREIGTQVMYMNGACWTHALQDGRDLIANEQEIKGE